MYSIVPINPRSGKIVKRPVRGQYVQVAIRGPRGGLKLLRDDPQKYFFTDFKGLNKQIADIKGGNFVVYQQRTRRIKRVDGKKKYYKGSDGTIKPDYESKVTFAQPRRLQTPVLYVKGKKKRELDIGYKTGNYQKLRAQRKILLVKPNQRETVKIHLQGRTIKEALLNLQLDVNLKQLKKTALRRGLFYTVMMKIITPDGEVIKIPVNGSWKYDGFSQKEFSYLNVDGKRQRAVTQKIDRVSNLISRMSTSIRKALKDVGYRFTSLAELKKIEKRAQVDINRMKKRGATEEQISKKEQAFENISRVGSFTYASDLKQLDKNYQVFAYIKFEMM